MENIKKGTVLRKEGDKFIVQLEDGPEISCTTLIPEDDMKRQLESSGLKRLSDIWNGFKVLIDLRNEPSIINILVDETKRDIELMLSKIRKKWCGTPFVRRQIREIKERLAKEFSVDMEFIEKLEDEWAKQDYHLHYDNFEEWARVEIPKRKKSKSEKNHSEGLKSNE